MFGFDRSGTTLLSMMMGAHPLLAVPFSAAGMWFRYADELPKYGMLKSQIDIDRMLKDLLSEERISFWNVGLTLEDVRVGVEPEKYGSVVASFHAAYAARVGKPHWGNIDIATLDRMDTVNDWFPDSRFIHIVRDGRDVALSHETYPYGASNTLECAFEWRRRLEINLKMGSILGPSRYRVVRYEDLVLETEDALRGLCAFAGLPYSADMLEYQRSVANRVPEQKRWLWPTLDKRPVKSNVFRWKSKLSKTKQIVFESNAGDMLDRLGYETSGELPKRVGAFLLEATQFLGRGGRFRRFSSKLGIARFVSRKDSVLSKQARE